MKSFFQNLISLISILIILAFIAYGVFWFFVSNEMSKALDRVWANQEEYLITINGEKPNVTGFPASPKITFSGNIVDRNGLTYSAPEFTYQGFTVPSQAVTFKAPQGFDFSGPVFKTIVHLDNFLLKVRIPADYPNRFDAQTLSAWQKRGGTLPIENLEIARGSLKLTGDGYLNLDPKLQPAGLITVTVSGLDDLLNELVQNGTMGEKQALMAQSLINLMSQKDPETGVNAITTGIRIQEGGVFLGPLRVASLPEWKWETSPTH